MLTASTVAAIVVLVGAAAASPPVAVPTATAPPTPVYGRDLGEDASSLVSSVTGAVASALPSVLGSWPSLNEIEQKLGVSDSDLQNISTSALLIPSYANKTDQGWNVRFYGLIYKFPNVNATAKLISLFNDLSTNDLNSTESALLQNRTAELSYLPVPHANVSALVRANGTAATDASGIALTEADDVGELDQFVLVQGLKNESVSQVQVIETGIANVTGPGNSTTILVPTQGYSVVSDIDDVLRITKVYVPNEGLKNSFVEPYVNVPGIPELFHHWLQTLPGAAFHYDTTTPVQLTRTYVDYLFANFPLGSLEMRPINISQPSAILDARQQSLLRLFETFPHRKFVLVGDTSSSTLLSAYPQIAQKFPNQTACIFIRNTSATDSDDKLPFSTSDFKNLNNNSYFFYRTSEDLFNLNISDGECRNSSVPQNVTFSEQGGVLGNGHGKSAALHSASVPATMVATTLGLLAITLTWL